MLPPPQFQAQRPQAVQTSHTVLPQRQGSGIVPGLIQLATAAKSLFGEGTRQDKLLEAQTGSVNAAERASTLQTLKDLNPEVRTQAAENLLRQDPEKYGYLKDLDFDNLRTDDFRDIQKNEASREVVGLTGGNVNPQSPQQPTQNPYPGIDPNDAPPVQQYTDQAAGLEPPSEYVEGQPIISGAGIDGQDVQLDQVRALEQQAGLPVQSMYETKEGSIHVDLSNFDRAKHPPAALLNIPARSPEDPQIEALASDNVSLFTKDVRGLQLATRVNALNSIQRGTPISGETSVLLSLNEAGLQQTIREMATNLGVHDPKLADPIYAQTLSMILSGEDLGELKTDPVVNQVLKDFNNMPSKLRTYHIDFANKIKDNEHKKDTLQAMKERYTKAYEVDKIRAEAQQTQADAQLTRAETDQHSHSEGGADFILNQAKAAREYAQANKAQAEALGVGEQRTFELQESALKIQEYQQKSEKLKAEIEQIKSAKDSVPHSRVVKQQEIAGRAIGDMSDTLASLAKQRATLLEKFKDPIRKMIEESLRTGKKADDGFEPAAEALKAIDDQVKFLTDERTKAVERRTELNHIEQTLRGTAVSQSTYQTIHDKFLNDAKTQGYAKIFKNDPTMVDKALNDLKRLYGVSNEQATQLIEDVLNQK